MHLGLGQRPKFSELLDPPKCSTSFVIGKFRNKSRRRASITDGVRFPAAQLKSFQDF